MQQITPAGKNRLSRRPFGPRLFKDAQADATQADDQNLLSSDTTIDGTQVPTIPWVYYPPMVPSNTLQGLEPDSAPTGYSNPPKRRRPLPPKPRNYLNDSRRRPLPPTTTTLPETQDIPFLFSSRSSQFTHTDASDPIKDPFGAPGGIPPDAPIWKNYMDEAKKQDQINVGNWNQSMDVILIFAGLFSAILTAFLIEFYHQLQPDLEQVMVDQLTVITHLLEASLAGQNQSTMSLSTAQGAFHPPGIAIWINILWFISLICSLGAAMGVMVIKQWLQSYVVGLSPDPCEYAYQHQYRYNAFIAWHVPSIISTLPFVMLLSVGLFLVGLGLQLLELHLGVAITIISFMGAMFLCYCLTLVLSIIYPACPYKTSGLALLQSIRASISSIRHWFLCQRKGYPISVTENTEIMEIRSHQPELMVSGITWLLGVSQQEEVIHNALLSVSQLSHTGNMVQKLQACSALEQLVQRAFVPLPPWGHEFWNKLEQTLPSHPIFLELSRASLYMRNLISVWHHPSYLALEKPPAISIYHEVGWKSRAWVLKNISEGKKPKRSNGQHQLDVENHLDSYYSCLFGNWLLLWRLLIQKNDRSLIGLARKGYDLNLYATIICTEVCHYHLQENVTPLYLPQDKGAFIDLHNLLWAVSDEGQKQMGLTDD